MRKDFIVICILMFSCFAAKSQQKKYDTIPVRLLVTPPKGHPTKPFIFNGYEVLWDRKTHETYLDSEKHERMFHQTFVIKKL